MERGTNRSCWISHSPSRFPYQLGSTFPEAESHTSCSLSNLNVVHTHRRQLELVPRKVPGQRIPRVFVTSPAEPAESGSLLLSHRLLLCLGVPVTHPEPPSPWPGTGSGPGSLPGAPATPPPWGQAAAVPEPPALNVLLSRQGGPTKTVRLLGDLLGHLSESLPYLYLTADSNANRKAWNLSSAFIFPPN